MRRLVVLYRLCKHIYDLRLPPHLLECRWAVGAVQRRMSSFLLHADSIHKKGRSAESLRRPYFFLIRGLCSPAIIFRSSLAAQHLDAMQSGIDDVIEAS